jgi:hypothetical protein
MGQEPLSPKVLWHLPDSIWKSRFDSHYLVSKGKQSTLLQTWVYFNLMTLLKFDAINIPNQPHTRAPVIALKFISSIHKSH